MCEWKSLLFYASEVMYLTVILTVEKGKGCYSLTAQASIDRIPLPKALGVSRITDGRSSLTEDIYIGSSLAKTVK